MGSAFQRISPWTSTCSRPRAGEPGVDRSPALPPSCIDSPIVQARIQPLGSYGMLSVATMLGINRWFVILALAVGMFFPRRFFGRRGLSPGCLARCAVEGKRRARRDPRSQPPAKPGSPASIRSLILSPTVSLRAHPLHEDLPSYGRRARTDASGWTLAKGVSPARKGLPVGHLVLIGSLAGRPLVQKRPFPGWGRGGGRDR
jgi:hypothetical protein